MEKLKMHSKDLSQDNLAKIQAAFPNCVTERQNAQGQIELAIDFDLLRQELSANIVEGPQERYRLDWPGKREAMLTANAPIAKTLRPAREESVNFDDTENLFIEGDNLDALKLLQETYLGKVKMIYIDPPYNTGNDFIYEDDFAENTEEFLQRSNQKDEQGNRLVSNPESSGRFHSDWLSMMLPRLKLARNLLKDDGIIFCSIDDNEHDNLKKLLNEVFGEKNFIGSFVWKSRQNKDNRSMTGASIDHEYIVCYSKSNEHRALRGSERNLQQYKNPDNDPRGDWASGNMVGLLPEDQRPNCHYDLVDPSSGVNYGKPEMGWRYDQVTMKRLIAENRILWPSSPEGRPRRKVFLSELKDEYTGFSSIIAENIYTRHGSAEVGSLIGKGVFDFPKPTALISELIEQTTVNDDLILDFYSGSGTTANAVFKSNAIDGYNRKFIAIQISELCKDLSSAKKIGYKTIAEISKERIRRAGAQILEGECHEDWNKDIGFRVLKVDTSNMQDVYYQPQQLDQNDLFASVDNIKSDRSSEDLLFQVLLDWGVDLTLPIRRESIQGKEVFIVDDNALVACFEQGISEELIHELAALNPLRAVFRDNGFASDAVKVNVTQIFKQRSPITEVKSI